MSPQKSSPSPTSLRTRTTCRICGSPELVPLLDLGRQSIAGAFADPGGEDPISRQIPLEVVRCDMTRDQNACGLVQLRHTGPGSVLYRSYWYRSGVNATMTRNLQEIAQTAERLVKLMPGDLVLDVGCNDGTLLDGYRTESLKALGVDPSAVARYAEEKGYEVIRDFFRGSLVRARYSEQRARVITSIAMFYDLESPQDFVSEVAEILADDGIWVMELHYLPAMLERNAFDTICHEHLEYYSLAVLEHLFAGAGLEVVSASLNEINGGSIRVFVGHQGRHNVKPEDLAVLQDVRIREFEMALDSPEPYQRFAANAERVRDDLAQTLRSLCAQGKSVHVYGASTKGNTILQYAGIDASLVECAADRNPDKWGSKTIGTNIPIVSEEDSRAMRPDYYLALPWHFLPEFVEREEEFLGRGGRFIVPLPEVAFVDGSGTTVLARESLATA